MMVPPQGLLTLVRSTFPAAQHASTEDIVIQATLPRYPTWEIELSRVTWEVAFPEVHNVTIVVKSRNYYMD